MIFFVDPKDATIVMEYIAGDRLKDAVARVPHSKGRKLFFELGKSVAKLHASGMMHGDLTTANVILRGDELVLLDFGLAIHSVRLEDHAVDLRLIKETLEGAHPTQSSYALRSLLDGYSSVVGPTRYSAVARQLKNIERRGRYARVD